MARSLRPEVLEARERIGFTKDELGKAPILDARYDIPDPETRGLVCTITPQGARTYYLVWRVADKTERIRIGAIQDVGLKKARAAAKAHKNAIAGGADPAKEKREARQAETLGELWDLFLERHAKARKRSWETDQKRWNARLKTWASRKVKEITRSDVVGLLDDITREAGPTQANRCRALLHTMFRVAQRWGWDVGNPVAGTPRNRESRKERYLTPHELRAFILAARAEENPVVRDLSLLLLVTGVRSHSLLSARAKEFDLRGRLWRIPPEHTKAGRELLVPLAPAAAELVKARIKSNPGREHLFPSNRRGEGFVAMPRDGLERIATRAKLTEITPHVLRHTFATTAETIGIPRGIIAEALGHTRPGGVTAVYLHVNVDLVRLAVEKTVAAMLRLAELTDEQVERGNLLAFALPAWAREEGAS